MSSRPPVDGARFLPRIRFELLPETGHAIYLDQRDRFIPRLRRFLAARDPNA